MDSHKINKPPLNRRALASVTLRKFFNFVGYAGALLILYSVSSEAVDAKWIFIERWALPASTALTLVGTFFTAASVYHFDPTPSEPENFSLYVAAPIVIGGTLIALYFLIKLGDLPPVVTNGFAMLGLAGAWFRIQRNPGIY